VAADDGVLADHRTFHDGGADGDQAVIADGAAVQHDAMRDRAIVANDGGGVIADVHHRVVLQIGEPADAHHMALGAHHAARPQASARADLDLAVHLRGGMDIGSIWIPLRQIRVHFLFPLCATLAAPG
jgi:hypothetical protein